MDEALARVRLRDVAVELCWCGKCGAVPGAPCVTVRGLTPGEPATDPHTARMAAVERAWRVGCASGMQIQSNIIKGRLARSGRMYDPAELDDLVKVGL